MGTEILLKIFVYLGAAIISVPFAKRLGLGSVLGYILAGIAIGPFGLGMVGSEGQDVLHFSEFGVVIMLFLIGLELEPSRLWSLRVAIFGMGSAQVLLCTLLLFAVGLAFDMSWRHALALAMILALSSTAIGVQTLKERKLMSSTGGKNAFSVLLFQDISVIPMLAILPFLAGAATATHELNNGHTETWVEGLSPVYQTAAVLGILAGIVVIGLFVMRPIFQMVVKTGLREIFTATALALIIGTAMLMMKVGLSPALGTFMAGVVLSGSEYRHELESEIEPFKGLLLGLFFISVGAGIDFFLLIERPAYIWSAVGILFAAKIAVLLVISRVSKLRGRQAWLWVVTLASAGEFAFVLLSYAVSVGVFSSEFAASFILVAALSMALSPLLFIAWQKIGRTDAPPQEHPLSDDVIQQGTVIIAGFGRFGNIVGRLLRANGILPTFLDIDADNVRLLRKVGLPVFYGDASRPELLLSAGAESASVIVVATDDHQSNIQIIDMCKKYFPQLKILARAAGRTQAYDLMERGVSRVYRETFDTALEMGVDTLSSVGIHPHRALRASRLFKKHDEEALKELAQMRDNKKVYLSRTKEVIRDLETIIRNENNNHDFSRDEAWDVSSRKEAAKKAATAK